jgi:hypothetical protein
VSSEDSNLINLAQYRAHKDGVPAAGATREHDALRYDEAINRLEALRHKTRVKGDAATLAQNIGKVFASLDSDPLPAVKRVLGTHWAKRKRYVLLPEESGHERT